MRSSFVRSSRRATVVSVVASVAVAVALVLAAAPAAGQEQETVAEGETLVVGTKEAPPFAMRDDMGRWTGISIELWREVAGRLGLRYELREYDLQGLVDALEAGEVDAGVAALNITGAREQVMDFSHPFYTTGFGIALVPSTDTDTAWLKLGRRLFSWRFLGSLFALVLVLLVVGGLVWLVERRANADHFGGSDGLWSGFWWAAVTMTTVGYGDKAPRTVAGRVLALVWMFTALAIIGTFIASMTSALTVSQLQLPIRGPEDLPGARVATVAGSTSDAYLRDNRIPVRYADDLEQALDRVVQHEVDAVVYDAPLLRYLVTSRFVDQIEVLPRTFGRLDYCIALPSGSELREPINRVLLADSTQARLRDVLFRYLEQAPPPPAKPQEDGGE